MKSGLHKKKKRDKKDSEFCKSFFFSTLLWYFFTQSLLCRFETPSCRAVCGVECQHCIELHYSAVLCNVQIFVIQQLRTNFTCAHKKRKPDTLIPPIYLYWKVGLVGSYRDYWLVKRRSYGFLLSIIFNAVKAGCLV